MSTDLTARVAELASRIEAGLAEDEALADRATGGEWLSGINFVVSDGTQVAEADSVRTAYHIARNDPARTLRRVKATRDLVAGILAEQHQNVDGDPWFSCSQAVYEHGGEPGSGCADDERAGKPCDCGRDQHVVKMLAIIASEWEE
jgi:hypothetical protein